LSPRYGNIAIPVLSEKLLRLGCHPQRLVAKIFGGGRVLKTLTGKTGQIGENNIQLAEEMLTSMKIPIVGRDTGGTWGRKLVFFTKDGSVWVKNIPEGNDGH
jgi:chemotaxis protein CheD